MVPPAGWTLSLVYALAQDAMSRWELREGLFQLLLNRSQAALRQHVGLLPPSGELRRVVQAASPRWVLLQPVEKLQ